MSTKKEANWVYNKPPIMDKELEERINAAEEALGFKLFYWQYFNILYGRVRHFGETTGKILHELLRYPDAEPINARRMPEKTQDYTYQIELIRIYHILKDAGVTVREVLLPEDDNTSIKPTIKSIIPSMISGIIEVGKAEGFTQKDILKEIQKVIKGNLEENDYTDRL